MTVLARNEQADSDQNLGLKERFSAANRVLALLKEQLFDGERLNSDLAGELLAQFQQNEEFFTQTNRRELTFHNPVHFAVVAQVITEELNRSDYPESSTQVLSELLALGHDLVVGGRGQIVLEKNFNLVLPKSLVGFADEIASALLLPQLLAKYVKPELQASAEYQKLVLELQKAILSTTVDRGQAAPPAWGGTSTITQFELGKHLGQLPEELKSQINTIWQADSTLANILCAADLGHFALADETKFWEMCLRYGVEVAGITASSSNEELKAFIKGQVDYLTNYHYPKGLPEAIRTDLEAKKKGNIARVTAKSKEANLTDWAKPIISAFSGARPTAA